MVNLKRESFQKRMSFITMNDKEEMNNSHLNKKLSNVSGGFNVNPSKTPDVHMVYERSNETESDRDAELVAKDKQPDLDD